MPNLEDTCTAEYVHANFNKNLLQTPKNMGAQIKFDTRYKEMYAAGTLTPVCFWFKAQYTKS